MARYFHRFVHLAFILSMLLVSGLYQTPELMAQDQASWTIMQFSAADTDLEEYQIADMNEMEWIGSTSDVHMVVQLDRTPDYTDVDGDWTDTRRFYLIEDADPNAITTQPVEILGETNQGDPQTLIDFVLWSIENYPAEKYALILSDHGGAWPGFGWDETDGHDALTMPELEYALATIQSTSGVTLDIFGMDACLMSQLEVAATVAPYARYAVLAQETEPGFGWSYDAFLGPLVQNPAMSSPELGQLIVDTYMNFYRTEVDWYDKFDLNVIDLSQVGAVQTALSGFSDVVQANPGNLVSAIGNARLNAQYFGAATPDEADSISSIDLIHFMELLQGFSDDAATNEAAQAVIDAARGAIVYSQASYETMPGAQGLAVHFPRNQNIYSAIESNLSYSEHVPTMTDWDAFLRTFYASAIEMVPVIDTEGAQPISIAGIYPGGTMSIESPPVIQFVTDATDIVEVRYSVTLLGDDFRITLDTSDLVSAEIDEEGNSLIDYEDGYTLNEFTWGAEMPVVTDGAVAVPTLLLTDRNTPDSASVSGRYLPQNGQEVTAYLRFDLETRQVTQVWGSSAVGGAPFEIKVHSGDQFIPTWRFIDDAGNVVLQDAASDPLTFSEEPFSFSYAPAASGQYELVMLLEDVAGNVYTDRTSITIDNEGLSGEYRGYTDVAFGMRFLYPWAWPEPVFEISGEDETRILISDPAGEINYYIIPYELTDMSLADFAQDYIVSYLDEAEIFDVSEVVAGGYEGSVVSYGYEGDDASYLGAVLAVSVPENDTTYIIDMDVIESRQDEAGAIFSVMLETLNFFAPPDDESMGEPALSGLMALYAEYSMTQEEIDFWLTTFDPPASSEALQAFLDSGELSEDDIRAWLDVDVPAMRGE